MFAIVLGHSDIDDGADFVALAGGRLRIAIVRVHERERLPRLQAKRPSVDTFHKSGADQLVGHRLVVLALYLNEGNPRIWHVILDQFDRQGFVDALVRVRQLERKVRKIYIFINKQSNTLDKDNYSTAAADQFLLLLFGKRKINIRKNESNNKKMKEIFTVNKKKKCDVL